MSIITKKVTISLPTIHCESCVKLIGMTLKNIPWIKNKEFNIEKRELYLKIDTTTTGEAIAKAIREDAEYEAIVTSEEEDEENHQIVPVISQEVEIYPVQAIEPVIQTQKETIASIAILNIEGMHCTSCSSLIEKSLRHVAGVEEANVNFASEKARVKFDPKKVNVSELEKAVAETWSGDLGGWWRRLRSETFEQWRGAWIHWDGYQRCRLFIRPDQDRKPSTRLFPEPSSRPGSDRCP